MDTVEKIYFKELKKINEKYSFLTKEQEIDLCKKIKDGDKKAEETLILSNLNLVIKVINKLHLSNVEKMDLIQDGNLALIEKAADYDYEKGARFGTFIWQWIWDEALKNNIRLSERDNRLMRKIQKIQNWYRNETGNEASNFEIASMLDMTEDELKAKLRRFENAETVPFDAPVKNDDETTFQLDMIEINNPYGNPDTEIMNEESIRLIQKAVNRLPEKERKVIQERYLNTSDESDKINSLREVAARIDMTSEGVRVIEKRALNLLKISLHREGLVA